MRLLCNLLLIGLTLLTACAEPAKPSSSGTDAGTMAADSLTYDSALASRLGADEYGMKPYVMAFLKRGPNRSQDSTEAARLQQAHMANINRLAQEGKLIVAGPFMDDGELRGIYLFDVATLEEAEALTATDPAIQAGRLVMELHPWYGSAALMQVDSLHRRLAKTNI